MTKKQREQVVEVIRCAAYSWHLNRYAAPLATAEHFLGVDKSVGAVADRAICDAMNDYDAARLRYDEGVYLEAG